MRSMTSACSSFFTSCMGLDMCFRRLVDELLATAFKTLLGAVALVFRAVGCASASDLCLLFLLGTFFLVLDPLARDAVSESSKLWLLVVLNALALRFLTDPESALPVGFLEKKLVMGTSPDTIQIW